MTRVIVHIDRLVLKGFDAQTREAIARGLLEELTTGLASGTAPRQLASHAGASVLRAGTIHMEHGAEPPSIGAQVARSIVRRMGS